MADLAYPALPAPQPGEIQGRTSARFGGVFPAQTPPRFGIDYRHLAPTTGTITDQVVVKAGAAEVPYVNGRVWLLRLADGYKAWEGWSDAAGNYTATGLELGVEYVAVAIDPLRNFKTVGAGPVTAV